MPECEASQDSSKGASKLGSHKHRCLRKDFLDGLEGLLGSNGPEEGAFLGAFSDGGSSRS
jgi:hypothetical protein